MSKNLGLHTCNEEINLDNYLDYNKQFTLNNRILNGYSSSIENNRIYSLMLTGKYHGFKLIKSDLGIMIIPIFVGINNSLVNKMPFSNYDDNCDMSKLGDNLSLNETLYFKFNFVCRRPETQEELNNGISYAKTLITHVRGKFDSLMH